MLDAEAGGTGRFTVWPTSIDLGALEPGAVVLGRTITVTATRLISDVSVATVGDDLFLDPDNTCEGSLDETAPCVVVVDFVAVAPGAKNASIVIDGDGDSVVVPVIARVVSPVPVTIDPDTPLDLYQCIDFTPYQPAVLQVTNVGSDSVGPLATAITGPDATAFQAQTSGCDLIPSGGVCTISIVFTPEPAGIDPADATLTVKDVGSGSVAAVFPLSGFIGSCKVMAMQSTMSMLGTMPVGLTSDPITFTVSWSGDYESGPLSVTVSSPDFVMSNDGCSGTSIAFGESCTFDVSLRPTSAGPKTATVTVSGAYQQTVSQTITGKGV